MRDSQRSKVYKADDVLVNYPQQRFETVTQCKAYVDEVRKRLTKVYPQLLTDITVGDGRGLRMARGGWWGIKLPKWARAEWVILHELAHTIAARKYSINVKHNQPWAEIYLDLVERVMGKEASKLLKDSFKAYRVKYKAPRQLSPETREKLRQRGLELAASRRKKHEIQISDGQ
jgi:putative metallohydrolase (TIGR04338 family)